jgi:hypothetical protein
MPEDYKMAAQMRAEEIAEERFGCDFYDLPQDMQSKVYSEGLAGHFESLMERADYLRKAKRESEGS